MIFLSSEVTSSTAPTQATSSVPSTLIHPNNTHSMQTRAKSGIVQPRLHPTLLLTHLELKIVKQALADSTWRSAMQEEFTVLTNNNT